MPLVPDWQSALIWIAYFSFVGAVLFNFSSILDAMERSEFFGGEDE